MEDSHAEDSDLDAKDSRMDGNDAEDVDMEQSNAGDNSNTEDSSNAKDSSDAGDSSDAEDSSDTRDNSDAEDSGEESDAEDSGEESDADANPASSQEATSREKHLRSLVCDYMVVLGPTVADALTVCKAKDIKNLQKQPQVCTLSTDIIIEYNVAPGFAFYNAQYWDHFEAHASCCQVRMRPRYKPRNVHQPWSQAKGTITTSKASGSTQFGDEGLLPPIVSQASTLI